MCGIFALLNDSNYKEPEAFVKAVEEGVARGPEQTRIDRYQDRAFVFHRLAINGLDNGSMQPIQINNIALICNGEIFNYKELFTALDIIPCTQSDCEVIVHLYMRYGIERTLELLDGEFSFVLHDHNSETEDKIYYARDPFGVRPLYICHDPPTGVVGIASELKVLNHIANGKMFIKQVEPGCYGTIVKRNNENATWYYDETVTRYFRIPSITTFVPDENVEPNVYFKGIVDSLSDAVRKRVLTADRDVACLLSGGLDSSLIAALACKHYGSLNTYSIGMEGSEDLRNARLVADHIGSKHTEIILSEYEFFGAIPNVIRAIESFDTTTVRASVGNYLVAKYIREHSEDKVVLNGDGSDEVAGGYIYMLHAPSDLEFDTETRRLLSDIHFFDVLRSDRSVSSNGLEGRTPFLDKTFVSTYLQIPAYVRNPRSEFNKNHPYWDAFAKDAFDKTGDRKIAETIASMPEKLLLRAAFYNCMPDLLPPSVLWRGKEAFSDGVSGAGKSWFEIIQNTLHEQVVSFKHIPTMEHHMVPDTKEKMYYRSLFCSYFNLCDDIVPYYWMPKFVEAKDSSARTLRHYTNR